MTDLNLPFEPVDPFQLPPELVQLSGGVVIAAITLADRHPALLLRFARADGSGFHPPVVLACDDPHDLEALSGLVADAAKLAIKACS
jgi:hypothetical protein